MVLAAEPAIIFLDEPTAGLSAARRTPPAGHFHGLSATYKIQTPTPLLILNLTFKKAGRRVRS